MEMPPLRMWMCLLRIEMLLLWIGTCLLRMETPLRGRSGGHTGAAPTISRVAPCPKVAGEVFADGQTQEMIAGRGSADKQTRGMVGGKRFADEQNAKRLRGRGV